MTTQNSTPAQDSRGGKSLHPYAKLAKRIFHIDQAPQENGYVCLGCQRPMTTVRGDQAVRHFRHLPPTNPCIQEQALRGMARELIAQHALDAQDAGREYNLTLPCRKCGKPARTINLAEPGYKIFHTNNLDQLELDIIARRENGQHVIIHIVTSGELDSEKKGIYEYLQQYSVFIIKPREFGDINQLRNGVTADWGIKIRDTCEACENPPIQTQAHSSSQNQQSRSKNPWLQKTQDREPDEPLPNREESEALIRELIMSEPTEPREPALIPFEHLPTEIQKELLSLPRDHDDPVYVKLCDQCGMPAVLFHEMIVWTGAQTGLGILSTITHKTCMNRTAA